MTARHPLDCYLTTADAALALRLDLEQHHPEELAGWHWLDQFAGPALCVSIVVGGVSPDRGALRRTHAWELDTRWSEEIRTRIEPARMRVGVDSLALPWLVHGGVAPHIVTNFPFGRDEAVGLLRKHAREHKRLVCALMRTDWWQHPGRFRDLRPDALLMLSWRPAFGFRRDDKTGKVSLSTDRFTGYVWALWTPRESVSTRFSVLERPEVPKGLRDEHRRLARMAYDFAAADAAGAAA